MLNIFGEKDAVCV